MTPAEKLAEILELKFIKRSFAEMVNKAKKKNALISYEVTKIATQKTNHQ